MHALAYYTGSFDPMHIGHIGTIKAAYKARPFKKLILCLGYNNVKKPNATDVKIRKPMVMATIKAADLPFEVEILPFNYLESPTITRKHFPDGTLRIIGSDSLINFISDSGGQDEKWMHFWLHHHLIFVRKLEGARLDELHAALKSMSPAVRSKFTYQIVDIQDRIIASSDIRKDVDKAHTNGLIAKKVYNYIKQHSLYS